MNFTASRAIARFKKPSTPEEGRFIDRLLELSPVKRALAEMEHADNAARADLAEALASAHRRYEKGLPGAVKAAQQAKSARERAELALSDTRRVESETAVALHASSITFEREIAALTAELVRTADPRIGEMAVTLTKCLSNIRHVTGPFLLGSDGTPIVVFVHAELHRGLAECRAMQVAADSNAAVEAKLGALADALRAPLVALGFREPSNVDGVAPGVH